MFEIPVNPLPLCLESVSLMKAFQVPNKNITSRATFLFWFSVRQGFLAATNFTNHDSRRCKSFCERVCVSISHRTRSPLFRSRIEDCLYFSPQNSPANDGRHSDGNHGWYQTQNKHPALVVDGVEQLIVSAPLRETGRTEFFLVVERSGVSPSRALTLT